MKKNKSWNRSWNSILLAMAVGVGMVSQALPVAAKVQGQCADCHTMHNSQGGAPMAVDAAGDPQAAPNDVLLTKGCVACHTGENVGGTDVVPYVNSTTAPTYGADGTAGANTLAGGNFYWVAAAGGAADTTGHNVGTDSLAGADGALGNLPPGGTALASQLSCAGTMGCHGDRTVGNDFGAISGTHHADDATIDGSTVATSFRFLNGVTGLEDSDWEYQATANAHNQYQGINRTAETDAGAGSISNLCAACHQDFHDGAGSVEGSGGWGSPWVRHPTDFDMGNTATGSEYRDYGGGSNAYVVSAPVASADVSTVLSTVNFTGDQAIVTCISCHRAHGTPNDDLLRWDYALVEAGGGGSGGCFECHTTKN
jgi:predicted CXXCH cytochrome family protein